MKENRKEKRKIGIEFILLIYFALKPLYLRESGFLQISDIFLLSSLVYLAIKAHGKIGLNRKNYRITKYFIVVLIYQAIINAIWSAITRSADINRHDLYYVFNFLAFVESIYIGQYVSLERIKRSIGMGSVLAVIFATIGLLVLPKTSVRSTGFFNNPNQLGYFAVIMLTVIVLCKEQLNKYEIAIIFVLSFWSIIVSLSKAAIIAYFSEIAVLILFYQKKQSVKRIIFELAALVIAGTAVYILFFSESSFVLNNRTLYMVRLRILSMAQENDSGLAYGRGYARVKEMLPHILWGTGEGAYERFTVRNGTEVHSTFASLLTCYGLFGLFGYIVLFKKCMGKGRVFYQNAIVLTGLFLYSFTHNGIRNTLLWMVMALIFLASDKDIEKKNSILEQENKPIEGEKNR